MKNTSLKQLLLCFLLALSLDAAGQIQVANITSTTSTCANNGTITIQATTANPPLLYSIISGPVIQGVQTNPLFSSLPAGNYIIKLTDGAGNETTAPTSIAGTYVTPNFTATMIKPYCVGESNGEITGVPAPGTGLAPFSWEILTPSPVTASAQSSSTFANLPAGNYTVKMTDDCGSYKTSVITLSDPNTTNPFYGGIGGSKIGCDSFEVRYKLHVNDLRLPFTYKYETSSGTYSYSSATSFQQAGGFITITQIIPGMDYGQNIKATVYNACGDSVSMQYYGEPFLFYPQYSFGPCGVNPTMTLYLGPDMVWATIAKSPLSYTVTDVNTSNVVDQGTNGPLLGVSVATSAIESGKTYQVTITDGCGETFTQNYTIPVIAPPAILKQCCNYSCLDSVMGYNIRLDNFTNPKLIITSGPATLGSTKPGFAYQDTYSYPDTFSLHGTGLLWLQLQNLAMGVYKFKVIDDCGREVFDSLLVITTSELTKEISYKKGCLGKNKIYFGAMQQAKVTIKDLSTNTIIKTRDFDSNIPFYNRDSILNVSSGQYEIYIQYKQSSTATGINDSIKSCWVIRDTITIEGYQTPEIFTGNAIMCNNEVNFIVLPDSTKGVPPYQYEVIAGPQIFPAQSSNVFTVDAPGIYTVRIYDDCGNASTKQITIDTLSFEPIEISTTCFNKKITFPPSLYFTYHWSLPNGQTYIGNELNIDPVTPADTGLYLVSKIVNINGCTDTLTTTFHIGLPNVYPQTITLCQGDTFSVGAHQYSVAGTYTDSLSAVTGCDSIIVTTLTFFPQQSDTTQYIICQGDSIQILGNYYSIPGFYVDSVQSASGCFNKVVSEIINNNAVNTISAFICQGQSYSLGNNQYTTSGIYTTALLSSAGCDSIVTLNLTVLPLKNSSFTQTICQGDSYTFGGNTYNQPGTYTTTFPTATCDSIVTLNLTVLPLKYSSFTHEICQGESYTYGGNTYNQSGSYAIVFPTTACDSIVTLNLVILPHKYSQIYDTICKGASYVFGGLDYTNQGVYTKTFPTSSCDSTVTLHLTVVSEPSVFITSAVLGSYNGTAEIQLNAISATFPLTYFWESNAILSNNTISNPTATIKEPEVVILTVTDKYGCSSTVDYSIGLPVTSTLYIPNSFTPDGDQYNNIFKVYGTNIADFYLLIFDRWGEIIFESYNMDYGWDGTYKGKIVQDGVYVYKILATGMDNVRYDKTGHVTVLK